MVYNSKSLKQIILYVNEWCFSFNTLYFVNSVLLTKESCYKFMLKYDIQEYLRKPKGFVFSEIQHTQKW